MGLIIPKIYYLAGKSVHRWSYLMFVGVMCCVVGGSVFMTSLQHVNAETAFPTRQFSGSIGSRASVRWVDGGAVTRDSSGNFLAVEYVDDSHYRIKKLAPDGSYLATYAQYSRGAGNGQFSGSTIGGPQGITTDHADNIIVADTGNSRIEVFTKDGQFVRTIGSSGSGAGQLSKPQGVAVDSNNNIYVVDTGNNRVEKFDKNGNFLATIGSSGTTTGTFNSPQRIFIDSSDNLYVVQNGNGGYAQKFTSGGVFAAQYVAPGASLACTTRPIYGIGVGSDGTVYATADGTLWCPSTQLLMFQQDGTYTGAKDNGVYNESAGPRWLLRMYGDTFYGPFSDGSIRQFDLNGTQIGSTASATDPGVLASNLYAIPPQGITQDGAGNTYVADLGDNQVQKFAPDGTFIGRFGAKGTGNGQFNYPAGVFVSREGYVYVADQTRLQKFTTDGTFVSSMDIVRGQSVQSEVNGSSIAEDSHGIIFVKGGSGYVMKFGQDDTYLGNFGSYSSSTQQIPLNTRNSIAIDSKDNVYVLNAPNYYYYGVNKYDSNGNFLYQTPRPANYQFSERSIAVDSYDNLYELMSDSTPASLGATSAIQNGYQVYNPSGKLITTYYAYGEDGGFVSPQNIYIAANNDIYITDANNYVQKFSVTGLLHAPSAPLNMAVTTGKGSAQVTWETPSSDGGMAINGYEVSFKPQDSDTWSTPAKLPATARSYSTDNLFEGGPYDVRIVAVNPVGESTPAMTTATVGYVYAPSAPLNLTVAPAKGSAQLAWQAPSSDGYREITEYDVSFKPHGSDTWLTPAVLPATARSFYAANLLNGPYDFRVIAVNAVGDGAAATATSTINYPYAYLKDMPAGDSTSPMAIAFAADGTSYLADGWSSRVIKYAPDGTEVTTFGNYGTNGSDPGALNYPSDIKVGPNGDVYVSDWYLSYVQQYTASGTFIRQFNTVGAPEINAPSSLAIDQKTGDVYVVDNYASVHKYDANGNYLGTFASDAQEALAVATDTAGNVYVADYDETQSDGNTYITIFKYASDGTVVKQVSFPYGEDIGEMEEPSGLTVDPSTGNILVVDEYNARVVALNPDMTYLNIIGTGWYNTTMVGVSDSNDGYMQFWDPLKVSFDPTGNLYITDDSNNRTTVLSSTGGSSQPSATAPSVPQDVAATSPTANTLRVTWNPPSDTGGSAITEYTIAIKPQEGMTWTVYHASASDRVITLTAVDSARYDVEVTAINSVGGGAPATISSIAVADPDGAVSTQPAAPQLATDTRRTKPQTDSPVTSGVQQFEERDPKPQIHVDASDEEVATSHSAATNGDTLKAQPSHARRDGVVRTLLVALVVFIAALLLFVVIRRRHNKRKSL